MKTLTVFAAALLLVGAGCVGGDVADIPAADEITFSYPDNVSTPEDMTELQWEFPGTLADEEIQNKLVRIQTEKGDIVFELYADTAPNTVSNFVYLTTGGYYNGLTFHRREEGFVIQGGDPVGNGTGGPGYKFADELEDEHAYDHGIVAMANSGPNTNGSQFFIMLADYPLPKAYTIFGKVTEGLDVVSEIQVGDVMSAVSVEDKQ
jgi:cyclophilin family peptidyl-prolyl cis-trans isomerase